MNYYDDPTMEARGIDWDLLACLQYNPQDFTIEDIARVLAVYEGENDGNNWRWIIRLTDGRFVFLIGGCDYTGWDCQSGATSFIEADIAAALRHAKNRDLRYDGDVAEAAWAELARQLLGRKDETWHETTRRELGL